MKRHKVNVLGLVSEAIQLQKYLEELFLARWEDSLLRLALEARPVTMIWGLDLPLCRDLLEVVHQRHHDLCAAASKSS